MKSRKYVFPVVLLVLFLSTAFHAAAVEEEDGLKKITKEEARALMAEPGVTVIDVRYERNWKKSDTKIAGAAREHPNEIGSWVGKYARDHTIVLYCD